MALLARTRNGEKHILNRLYTEAQTVKRVMTAGFVFSLSAQQVVCSYLTNPDFWSPLPLLILGFKFILILILSWGVGRTLAESWFDFRTFLSFCYLQFRKYVAGLKRIPPSHIRLYCRLTFWFLIYTTPIPRLIFIRAGPRPPKQSPFALFMRAPLLVAP